MDARNDDSGSVPMSGLVVTVLYQAHLRVEVRVRDRAATVGQPVRHVRRVVR